MSKARELLEFFFEEDENPVIPPNRSYRGDADGIMDQTELDDEHQLQGKSHGYSYNKNSGAGPGPKHPDGKRGSFKNGVGSAE